MSIQTRLIRRPLPLMTSALVVALLLPASTDAAPLALATAPLYTTSAVKPQVMIDMSKDQQLFFKAYNDYSDLLGDGVIQTTYTNNVEYYGYFDSAKCYDYSTARGRFEPAAMAVTHYCTGKWSGNFLNWATMSRMDAVRKLLYGGMRATDGAETVLERSFQPMDAHSWAKYYNGPDLSQLTPFSVAQDVGTSLQSTSSLEISAGLKSPVTTTTWGDVALGDQVRLTAINRDGTDAAAAAFMVGWVSSVGDRLQINVPSNGIPSGGSGTYSRWTLTNLTRTGVTLCNVTPNDTTAPNRYSQNNSAAPQIRVARGNYALWASNERWQCNWAEEHANTQGESGSSNGNVPLVSGMNSSADNPKRASRGLNTTVAPSTTGEYIARVQVCVAGLRETEKCKRYPDGTYKPIGLLHTYGDSDSNLMQFGMMSGSYQKNISGGVLRRNVVDFASEVDGALPTSNGKFSSVKGIVYNMNLLRLYGYDYGDGTYIANDGCTFQMPGLVQSGGGTNLGDFANEGNCSSWGNPMSEIYLESLRYFAGKSPTSSYGYPAGSKDDRIGRQGNQTLGLTVETWVDPLTVNNYCSALNTLVFNPSVSSYDGDQMGGINDLGSTLSAADLTTQIGITEGINGNKWFVGSNAGSASSADGLCTAKTVNGLGLVAGLCPEGPGTKGTFQIAGAAWYAHTNRIRSRPDPVAAAVPAADTKSLKVTTYGIQLAGSTPKINLVVNGKPVVLLPAYRMNAGGRGIYSSGTLVDFKIISQTPTSGSFYVNWEDSSQGGDFDQDVWGMLNYVISGNTLKITTGIVGASSINGQGFGYVISGTDKDGPHFHSGVYGYSFTDPTNLTVTPAGSYLNASGGCNACAGSLNPPTTATYQASGEVSFQLQDPLFYAAKWGGFIDGNGNGKPDNVSEWDTRLSNGRQGSDGIPDNYFYVTNPAALEVSLQRAFQSILLNASSASVASSSTSLNTGAHIYQARFNPSDWSGQLQDFPIDRNGVVAPTPLWDAGAALNGRSPASRVVLSYNGLPDMLGEGGIAFNWAALPAPYKSALNINSGAINDGRGELRLNWIRGNQTLEGTAFDAFRVRRTSVLGDIVNSNPQFVGKPDGGYADPDYPGFISTWSARTPMVYVGSNDGMLHGFSATDGTEKLAFVPSRLMPVLSRLPDQGLAHSYLVDGTPIVRDAKVNGAWKTFLVGGLASGGPSVFALDVTDPDSFSEAATKAAAIVQWEFTDAVDADLGFTFGQPSIVKMANGRWAAVFGNGYNNTSSGNAFLYIVFLDRAAGKKTWTAGVDYLKLATDSAIGSPATPNGLSEPLPVDVDGNGMVDAVYAGDLRGNMWKFALSNANSSAWGAAQLLYTAKSASGVAQPITSAPDAIRNPAGGYMVTFGTGRYLQLTDTSDLTPQTFYGIWDPDGVTGATSATDRSVLVRQTMLAEVTASATDFTAYRLSSNNLVNYPAQKGWYLDLQTPSSPLPQGERVIFNPVIRGGRVIFTTLIPSSTACVFGGDGWLMELDAVSGSRLAVTPFDVNKDNQFSAADYLKASATSDAIPVSGRRSTIGIPSAPTILRAEPKREFKVMSGSKGTVESVLENAAGSSGRLSWREIMR
ncbi:PilC/PilY family type IV pilus protein [Actimicrobium sp. CCC2.4]|uniref:pilus assembly protein n=1 Tax=Actimicrobium sp. CCC2.4 TaxID=3048606 RepID=UPI002AC8DB5F|nr:PilC/PilY family type IV pilus protein [Actimicrobium sp. CCC2.4]MEB0135682.1 PilC/PilY family type IV pilus protein [Actimicrobium sp. CCC2.4]WPX33759.1 PilC/PilY family type IV pilus protein [Actimicrobium sp. CCC2.4]